MRLTRRTGSAAAFSALLAMMAIAPSAGAATFTVNSNADTEDTTCSTAAGGCTLHDAVDEANSNAGADTIVIPADHYVNAASPFVFMDTSGATTLTGAGAANTIIDADGAPDLFEVQGGASAVASGITLTGATQSAVNVADGGSIGFVDSRLTHNASGQQGGGAIFNDGGDVSLTRTEADHNYATFNSGGAIENANGFVNITDSWLHANTADDGGGAIDNEITGAVSSLGPSGKQGQLTITGSTLSDNVAAGEPGGGAINSSGDSGGPAPFAASVVSSGTGPTQVDVTNSTLSGNTSIEGGGGTGGALAISTGNATFTSSTIVDNHAPAADGGGQGGGVWVGSGGSVSFRNSLLAGNVARGIPDNCEVKGGTVTSQGHNLESADTCGFKGAGDQVNTNPNIGPLADNGGLTPTHALLDGSPAIDKGDNSAGPGLDQRGGHRPPGGGSAGDTRDIGAYEAYSLADLTVEAKFDAPDPVTAGTPLTYSLVVRNNGPDRINGVTLGDPLPGGTTFVSASPTVGSCTSSVSCSLGSLAPGAVVKIPIVVTPSAAGTLSNTATVASTGYTETNSANDHDSASTRVVAATVLPPPTTPSQDKTIVLNFSAPKRITLSQFMNGFVVSADCGDELCFRRFREHAAINTGATHIAGFNLTVERSSLGFTKQKRIRLKPCVSGSSTGRAHKRCVRNLRAAAKKALPFRVKVVCSAVDKAKNRKAKKLYIKVVSD